VGNRLSSVGVSPYSYNSSNQLTSIPGTTYTYDNNGNTKTKTTAAGTTTYTWDFENRLTQVALPGTGGTVTYKYDPFGRRVQKSFTQGGNTTTTNYLYDGSRLLEEVDQNGNVVARYSQGPGVDRPLAENRSGTTSYYEADGLGSVTSLSTSSGTIANTYGYDSFGNLTASTGSTPNPYRYTGREFDPETGSYYYRARYYETGSGRFVSEDPVRFQSGTNFYAYVVNNPLILSDPSGLCSTTDFTNHYWNGGGSAVNLGAMGLGGAFEGAPTVGGAISSFESSIVAQGASLAGSLCAGKKSGTQVAVFTSDSRTITDVTNVPCLFSVGHSTFFERATSTLVADCCSHKFTIRSFEHFFIRDRFADPLSLGFEIPGGHPYPINYDFYRSKTVNGTF